VVFVFIPFYCYETKLIYVKKTDSTFIIIMEKNAVFERRVTVSVIFIRVNGDLCRQPRTYSEMEEELRPYVRARPRVGRFVVQINRFLFEFFSFYTRSRLFPDKWTDTVVIIVRTRTIIRIVSVCSKRKRS